MYIVWIYVQRLAQREFSVSVETLIPRPWVRRSQSTEVVFEFDKNT